MKIKPAADFIKGDQYVFIYGINNPQWSYADSRLECFSCFKMVRPEFRVLYRIKEWRG